MAAVVVGSQIADGIYVSIEGGPRLGRLVFGVSDGVGFGVGAADVT